MQLLTSTSLSGFLTKFFCAILFLTAFCFCSILAYEVDFQGVSDEETLKLIKQVSQLVKLKDQPPATLTALKKRAENDIPNILKVLHSEAKYGAKINYEIKNNGQLVMVEIDSGAVFIIDQININYFDDQENPTKPRLEVDFCDLELEIGTKATPETILNAEDLLLDHLNLQGYAFAKIREKKVQADIQNERVNLTLNVNLGPLTYFGVTDIKGLKRVKKSFVNKKIKWHEGDIYNPKKVEKTQESLELSGLFKTVNISHTEEPVDEDLMPFTLNLVEAKQHTVGVGINFNTQLGPGISTEWEDRNFRGEGEKLSFKTDLWSSWQFGKLSYVIPDFKRSDQNLVWQLNYDQIRQKAFTERAISLSAIIERRVCKQFSFSYGGMFKHLLSERSENDGTFNLLKMPLQAKWSTVDDLLDPKKGFQLNLVAIPSLQFIHPSFAYCINTMTASAYQILNKKKSMIFAVKLMVGSIYGANKNEIPPPERFYAGSQNTLRGYRFLTVSPLDKCDRDKPIGGRSMLIYTLELRNKLTDTIGIVAFMDIGNVYAEAIPDPTRKILRDVGLGLRYFTPVGPLRLDIAFPLDRREHIDNFFEAYFSIGQSF